ncbi:MAG: sulfatase-like hydrolase/transferase [Holophagales bacterium]|nr:sulfatase-like hydrolase/transferase [Holophagales bacterium]
MTCRSTFFGNSGGFALPLGWLFIVLSALQVVNEKQKGTVFRHRGLNALALALVVAAFAACQRDPAPAPERAAASEPAESVERPFLTAAWTEAVGDLSPEAWNVVLVTIDTLRADRLGCYGYAEIETPQLDRLASEGILFENALTTVPFTLPAHTSIMTGVYPPVHGVRENVGYALDERLPTLAEDLSVGGRRTGGFISAFVLDGRWGIDRGFDRYYDEFKVQDVGMLNMGSVQRSGTETIGQAEAWLDEAAGSPFFLWLHLFEPHDPYEPPEPFASRYPERPYDAEVAYTDSLVGRFRGILEDRDLLERTLLVVTADHGEGLGDHGEYFHGYFVYDSTARVPLIVRLPEGRLGGRRVAAAVSHVDLRPTILAALGVEAPAAPLHQGGRSLLPLLLGLDDGDRVAYIESYYALYHYDWAPLRAIHTGSLKFIDAPEPELYSLADDPGETENVVRGTRAEARELRDRLLGMIRDFDQSGSGEAARPDLDQETLAQLQALGYLAGSGSRTAAPEDLSGLADPKGKIAVHRAIMLAQSDIGKGETAAARQRLLEAIELDPGVVDAQQMLGNLHQREGDFDAAIGYFRNALARNPNHQASLMGLADSYLWLDRPEDALVGFERLRGLAPHDSKAAIASTDILVDLGRQAEALEVAESAARYEHAPALVHNQHGELLALAGRVGEAEEAFERAIQANDRPVQPHFNLAVLYEERGETARAIERYKEALARMPWHYRTLFNLGRLLGREGDVVEQEELWLASVNANPEFIEGHYLLAKLLMDQGGDLERAEELVRAGLAQDETHQAGALGYFVLADILSRLGRTAEAMEAVRSGREIQARTPE